MKLYIDSSEYLTLGLLDSEYQWVDTVQISAKKNAEIFHSELYEMLKRAGTRLEKIETAFHCAGPGSYTGMRLSDGICQVLDWRGIAVYSFYHFEVPQLIGIDRGVWLSEAFKGELFCYEWNLGESTTSLVGKDGRGTEDIVGSYYATHEFVFTHYPVEGFDCEYTADLIRRKASLLFEDVEKKKMKRSPYYYRPLEKEFKQTQR